MNSLIIFAIIPFAYGQMMPGGYHKLKLTELKPELVSFVTDSLSQKYFEESGQNLIAGQNVVLTAAESQVVAGINYKLHFNINTGSTVDSCVVTIWEQSWMNTRKITDSTCKPKYLAGGAYTVVISDEFKKAAAFAGDAINKQSNDAYYNCVLDILEPKQQVVAGLKYTMKLVMGQSKVRKNQGGYFSSTNGCHADPSAEKMTCTVSVWYKSWQTPHYVLSDSKCGVKEDILKKVDELLKEDKKPETTNLLGGDGHDLCHGGMFAEFKDKYKKTYETTNEESKRFEIFCQNMRKVRKIQETEKGSGRYGATIFADMTEKEFSRYRNGGRKWDLNANKNMKQAQIPNVKIPDDYDWRSYNVVTAVKNQGSCGSCWAFSTTGNIEGQWKIKKNKLVSLSEQELVDCDKVDDGCEGGLPSNAYKEIIRLGGLERENDYKYDGKDEKCHFKKAEVKVYINSSVAISKNEDEMAAWLYKNGPISIGINAMAMQFYFGGISYPWKIFCNPSSLDHGVLIVGFGKKGSEPYWIIKNSWGPTWGEKGYYLVYRGAGVCGLNQMCTSAVVD